MINNKYQKTFLVFILLISCKLFSEETKFESISDINWITKEFTSKISLDTKTAKIEMPSGKKSASLEIKTRMPQLIQPSLLSLFVDSTKSISDSLQYDFLSQVQINNFILDGHKTPDVFSTDTNKIKTKNTTNVQNLSKLLIKHDKAFLPNEPIDIVPSRAYSGIIIDARGKYPVHGEYIESEVYPCLFPTIWDDEMEEVFEKTMTNPSISKEKGIASYHYSDNIQDYENIVGSDPLYIRAVEVYGRNRTDPLISRKDALKILTIKENVNLIEQGKIVILLDKENLIYTISIPEKDQNYYANLGKTKQYYYENKVPGVTVSDSPNGILFSVDLKFIPDSPELLPSEIERIQSIAEQLKYLVMDDSYTILIEGHTADVGKPTGQLNLSIDRTRTVMNELINEGLNRKLFSYKGYGGTMPVATNDTEEGRAQNRRVDITARPKATYIQRDW